MQSWKTLSRKTIVEDQWISVHADECELPNGQIIAPFYVLGEKEWVHVLAVDARGMILMIRQYRYAADKVCSELPSGAVNAGEDLMEAAKRELREETGYVAAEWKKVGEMMANPARQTNHIHCFLARGLTYAGPQELDDSEQITVEFVTPEEIIRQMGTGEFCQAFHVATYFLTTRALAAEPLAVSPA